MKNLDLKSSTIGSTSAQLFARLLAVATLLLAFSVTPASANNNGCSNATLKGDYGFTISGYQPNSDGTMSPIKGVAITHFDGAGKLTQRDFVVTAGVPPLGDGNPQIGFQFFDRRDWHLHPESGLHWQRGNRFERARSFRIHGSR